MSRIDDLISEQRKTNELLRQLVEKAAAPINKTGWPLYVPTIEDELAAVEARGGDKVAFLRDRAREEKEKEKAGRPRKGQRKMTP